MEETNGKNIKMTFNIEKKESTYFILSDEKQIQVEGSTYIIKCIAYLSDH